MRTGLVVTGVVLLILGILVVIGGAPILGMGQTANDYCRNGWGGCGGDDVAAGAMFVSLGYAMMWGGGLLALAGGGLLVAGVLAPPKVPAQTVPVAAPVSTPRPCPSCGVSVAAEARYCGGCGAAIAPVKPRVSP
ncbi:MAG TPA: hypothetical protein VNX21_00800 [Candidatus Thermoplasmatota archaeon]|nr:hypothetical protein [Candidatus Thermoplasmatota archaeon]